MIIRAENSHDCLVDTRQEHAQWIAYLLMRPFLSSNLTDEQQMAMTDYIVSSADTPVWSLTLATDPEKPDVHLMMEVETNETAMPEGDAPDEQALKISFIAALGGFVRAEVDPQTVELLEAHISPSEQFSADKLLYVAPAMVDGRYRVPDIVAQDLFLDEREGYGHLQNFGHSFI